MGMVVRTNTMALNAYRQLGMNNSAVAKSLEKLASGYRINRAGDDAAGLAISEKMKAQITGLETASANAQDGISLIQTAEGNLNEVHDMLNRMVELASKSANGTYTVTERQALQDEMDQLLSEIDRISQSANFNGTRLLDGSMSGGVKVANPKDVALTVLTDGQLAKSPQKGIYSVDFTNASISDRAADPGSKATGSVSFSFTGTPTWADGDKVVITSDGDTALNMTATYTQATDTWAVTGAPTGFNATINGGTISLEAAAVGKKDLTADSFGALTVKATTGAGADHATATGGNGSISITDGKDAYALVNSQKFNIFGTDLDIDAAVGTGKTIEGADIAKAVVDAWNAKVAADGAIQFHGQDVTIRQEGAKVVFEMEEAPDQLDETFSAKTGAFVGDLIQNNGHEVTVTVEQEPVSKVGRLYGQASMDMASLNIVDGTTLKIGDTTYVFALGTNSKYKDADNAVDLTDLTPDNGKLATIAAARLSDVAADNKNFKVGSTIDDSTITFTEREGGVDYEKNNLAGADGIGTTDIGGAATTGDATATDWKGLIVKGMVDTSSGSKALTLQIGDTADSFNKMSVSVADMSAKGLGLDALKKTGIMTEANASNAIDTIKTAINTVSSTRAGLGALQNRLEHTINNLDVAAENLSAANSRIRDTDMAKEMMNYTKMNVLVQSAQAMLAQANQQPQSVLQLLQ